MKKDLNSINRIEKTLDSSERGWAVAVKKVLFMICRTVSWSAAWLVKYVIALILFAVITLPLLFFLIFRKVFTGGSVCFDNLRAEAFGHFLLLWFCLNFIYYDESENT